MYWTDLREPSGSFFNPCSSSRHKPEVHTNDLDRAVCALVQIVRIFADADFVTTERPMLDREIESLSAHIIQDVIFNLNRKTMARHVESFYHVRLSPPVKGTKDYACSDHDEDD